MNGEQVLLEFILLTILVLKHCHFLRENRPCDRILPTISCSYAVPCLSVHCIVCSCLALLAASKTGAAYWITFTSISSQRDQGQTIGQLSNSFLGRPPTFVLRSHLCRFNRKWFPSPQHKAVHNSGPHREHLA
jgi:hypothetical protein